MSEKTMNRRAFLRRLIPCKSQNEKAQSEKPSPPASMTENERFLYAMAQGIDPATITPGHLEKLVSE